MTREEKPSESSENEDFVLLRHIGKWMGKLGLLVLAQISLCNRVGYRWHSLWCFMGDLEPERNLNKEENFIVQLFCLLMIWTKRYDGKESIYGIICWFLILLLVCICSLSTFVYFLGTKWILLLLLICHATCSYINNASFSGTKGQMIHRFCFYIKKKIY